MRPQIPIPAQTTLMKAEGSGAYRHRATSRLYDTLRKGTATARVSVDQAAWPSTKSFEVRHAASPVNDAAPGVRRPRRAAHPKAKPSGSHGRTATSRGRTGSSSAR